MLAPKSANADASERLWRFLVARRLLPPTIAAILKLELAAQNLVRFYGQPLKQLRF